MKQKELTKTYDYQIEDNLLFSMIYIKRFQRFKG